jgi:replicative DNA helicase
LLSGQDRFRQDENRAFPGYRLARLTRAAGILHDSKIFIDDTPAISVLELRSKARSA